MVEDLPRWSHLSADAQVLRQQAHGVRHDGRGQEQQKTFRWIDLLYFIVVNLRRKVRNSSTCTVHITLRKFTVTVNFTHGLCRLFHLQLRNVCRS